MKIDWVKIAGILGFIGVLAGAFGAHALKARLTPELLHAWNTGVQYQLVHALALLAMGLFAKAGTWKVGWIGRFFLAGVILFSGSLYVLSVTGIKIFGAITPLGGICFLIGWGLLVFRKD